MRFLAKLFFCIVFCNPCFLMFFFVCSKKDSRFKFTLKMGKNNKSKSLKTLKNSNPSKKDGKQQLKKSEKGKMGFIKGASLATGKSSCNCWRNFVIFGLFSYFLSFHFLNFSFF